MGKLTIEQVNNLSREQFVNIFKNAVESYPEASETVFLKKPFGNVKMLCDAFSEHLKTISMDDKLKVLRLHPILAGKQADKGELTEESTQEQKAAKLNTLDVERKEKMNKANSMYLEKYGFPFIICVAENTVQTVEVAMNDRMNNTLNDEIITGINEVKKICRLRILNLVEEM